MARRVRIEYPGAVYHVMARGDHGESVFQDDHDRSCFLATLGDACEKTGWQVHAYILMPNHYHLLLETPESNLVAGMKWLQSTYTRRYNLRQKVHGHLFQGRYRALVIDPQESHHFEVVSTYIHLNPARAGLVRIGQESLEKYRWSSYPLYLLPGRQRPSWLQTARVLGSLGLVGSDQTGIQGYATYLESRVLELAMAHGQSDLQHQWKQIRRAWFLGSEPFRVQLLGMMDKVLSRRRPDSYSGEAKRSHDEQAAESLLRVAMQSLGWVDGPPQAKSKGMAEKKVLAWWLRERTTVSRRWVSDRLWMGDESRVTKATYEVKRASEGRLAVLRDRLLALGKAEAGPVIIPGNAGIPEFLD